MQSGLQKSAQCHVIIVERLNQTSSWVSDRSDIKDWIQASNWRKNQYHYLGDNFTACMRIASV